MIIPEKKRITSIILSKMGEGGKEKSQEIQNESEVFDEDEPMRVIAEDMLQAFKDGSSHDLMTALQAFMDEYQVRQTNAKGE